MNEPRKQQNLSAVRLAELNRLARGICRCRKCRLCKSRKHAVPGEGKLSFGIIFVGEAPGKNEDEQGRPFVGISGKFLNSLLEEAGLSRGGVFITGSVKCRPPNNRTPKKDELKICKENWLNKQIEIIEPNIIVLLGKTALYQILGEEQNLDKLHGQIRQFNGHRCLITFHPAAAMRFPRVRENIKAEFAKIKKITQTNESHFSISV